MTDMQSGLGYKRNLSQYLRELSALCGSVVGEKELMPLSLATSLRDTARRLEKSPTRKIEISFEAKCSARFSHYIDALYSLNPSPVYIWTARTNVCGPFQVDSIKTVDFSFDYGVNTEGIVVLLASNCLDKMVLDFSEEADGKRSLVIEVTGDHWPSAVF